MISSVGIRKCVLVVFEGVERLGELFKMDIACATCAGAGKKSLNQQP